MPVTFKDVANLAGVSTQTVSRVTNGSENVAQETRDKVNQAIKQLGYVPNKGAQMLSRAKSKVIGIVSLDISLHGVALIANGIRSQAHKMGYASALAIVEENTFEQAKEALKELISQQVESVIINFPLNGHDAEALVEQYQHLHFVFIDVPKHTKVNYVCGNNEYGAQLAVQKLLDLKRQDFLLITGPNESTASLSRCQQWLQQIHASGKNVVAQHEGNWQAASAYLIVRECISKRLSFDAILVANDQMALGVLCALNELKVSVPQQVSVIGFDDIADSAFFTPALTTVKQDFIEIGKQAVIAAVSSPEASPATIQKWVDVELVERDSCAEKSNAELNKALILEKIKELSALVG